MTAFDQRSFDQAVAWFVALQDERCEAKTRARFERWLASDASHREAYAAAQNLWGNLDNLKQLEVPGLDAARSTRPRARHSARGRVAGLLLAIAAVAGWQDYQAPILDITTGIGERRSVVLADGSRIELNAASHLTAKVSWLRREVQLHDGEAMFDVEHRAFPAFTVAVENFEIRDLGTRFNVRLLPDATRVSVLEGEVSIKANDAWGSESLAAGYARCIPKIGRWHPVESRAPAQASAWLTGQLVFEHTPLSEVVYEMQRYHDIRFVFADPALAKETLSGKFNAADLKPFLNALGKILPVKVHRERDRVILSRRR